MTLGAPWTLGCETASDVSPSQCGDALFVDGGPADVTVEAAPRDAAPPEAAPMDAAPADAVGASDAIADARMDVAAPASDARAEASAADSGFDAALFSGVRVANWSPDTPAVDFCVGTPGSSAYRGPILRAAGPASGVTADGGLVGLTFPSVSAYSFMPAGPVVVRIVAALATDCSVPIVSDIGPGDAGATPLLLVALMGTGSARKLYSFADDVSPASSSSLAVRFLHAAPGVGPLSFGTGDPATSFTALFSGVPFGQASLPATAPMLPDGGSGPRADGNGYLQRSAFAGVTLSALSAATSADAGPTTFASTSNFSAAAGAVVTFAAVGTSSAPALLVCIDNAGTTGLYSTCSVAP